jgi:hypothetical protein
MNSASKRKEEKKNLQTDDPFKCEYKRKRRRRKKKEIGQ